MTEPTSNDILAHLRRAHAMSVSDPTDPSRQTLYSRAADEIERLLEEVAMREKDIAFWERSHDLVRRAWPVEGEGA